MAIKISAVKEKAKAKKEKELMNRTKEAELGLVGGSKEPVYERFKRVEAMPAGIRVIDNEVERKKQLDKVMGGPVERVKQQERVQQQRSKMDKMFGKDGKPCYNEVPPPEFYTEEDWEAAHKDSIKENLNTAEAKQHEINDEMHPMDMEEEETNDVNEVD